MNTLELKLPPVVVFAVCGALMYALAQGLPTLANHISAGWRLALFILLLLPALILGFGGVWHFVRARTTVNPHTPHNTQVLVTHGFYRFSRNPMYLSLLLMLLGWAICLASLPALLILPLFTWYMTRFQIRPEERFMAQKFGKAYLDYQRRVRRWL